MKNPAHSGTDQSINSVHGKPVNVLDVLRKDSLPVKRLAGVLLVFIAVVFYSWKDTDTAGNIAATAHGHGAVTPLLASAAPPSGNSQKAPDIDAVQVPVSKTLKGHFSAGNKAMLFDELGKAGYLQFFSYQYNPDGSALITAIQARQSVQPIVSISVSKDGSARVTSQQP